MSSPERPLNSTSLTRCGRQAGEKATTPPDGSSSCARMARSVLLPLPESPQHAKTAPGGMSRSTLASAASGRLPGGSIARRRKLISKAWFTDSRRTSDAGAGVTIATEPLELVVTRRTMARR